MYSITPTNKNSKHPPPNKKTLDIQHNIKMQQFQDKEKKMSSLQIKYDNLKDELDKYEKLSYGTSNIDKYINQIIDIQDEIVNIEKQIKDINHNADEIDYLINNANVLFKYYDIIDKGSQDDSMLINKKNIVQNSILKYLFKNTISEDTNDSFNSDDKASLLEKYMECTEYNYVKNIEVENKDKCHFCDSSNRNIMLNDGIIYCNNCHTIEYIIIDHDRPSYKDPPRLWAEKSYCENYQNMFSIKQFSILIFEMLVIFNFKYMLVASEIRCVN